MNTKEDDLDYGSRLKRYLSGVQLPGTELHKRVAPISRFPEDYDPMPDGARRAAVLLLLFPTSGPKPVAEIDSDDLNIVLIERPHNGTTHSGEIAFPGGAHEGNEEFPEETALRETEEEIGVGAELITLCGILTPLYIPVSNFSVVPVVGAAARKPAMRREPGEVAAIHTAPLTTFAGQPVTRELPPNRRLREAPGYRFGKHFIWGATAMMIAELVEVDRRLRHGE